MNTNSLTTFTHVSGAVRNINIGCHPSTVTRNADASVDRSALLNAYRSVIDLWIRTTSTIVALYGVCMLSKGLVLCVSLYTIYSFYAARSYFGFCGYTIGITLRTFRMHLSLSQRFSCSYPCFGSLCFMKVSRIIMKLFKMVRDCMDYDRCGKRRSLWKSDEKKKLKKEQRLEEKETQTNIVAKGSDRLFC